MKRITLIIVAAAALSPMLSSCALLEGSSSGMTAVAKLERQLSDAQFTRTSAENILPSTWTNTLGDVVSLDENLGGDTFVKVSYAEGVVQCDHAGDEPSGPNPARFIIELRNIGRDTAIATKPQCHAAA